MSCYHPLIGIPGSELSSKGKPIYQIRSSSSSSDPMEELRSNDGAILIPCGRCIGCRLDYSRSWADRMMLELETCDRKAIFLTLTYDNDHITWSKFDEFGFPVAGTLVKKDFQLFMKRLRKNYTERRIRFYAAGEYGDHTFRPHYHVILFGIGLDDVSDLHSHGVNELGQTYYISDSFARIWNNGFVLLSAVSWKTCAYVARYVTKKLGYWNFHLDYLNQEYPFALMSRKPGLGREYLDQHPDCLDYQNINLSTPEGGLQIRIPKYFLKQMDKEPTDFFPNPLYDPEKYANLMRERSELASDSMLLKLEKTGLGLVDYLEAEEDRKLRSIKSLKREMSFNL